MNINWRNVILGAIAILAVSYVTFARADSVLAWSPVVTYVDGTPIPTSLQSQVGYAVYSKPCGSTATPARLNMPLLLSTTSYTWKPVPGCYTLTVTSNLQGAESSPTNPMNVTIPQFPAPPANPTTGLVTSDTTTYTFVRSADPNGGIGTLAVLTSGTVAKGVKCDATQGVLKDGIAYYAVPWNSVTFTGTIKPYINFAKCL